MSDLQRYIKNRKMTDPGFARNWDEGYHAFKMTALAELAQETESQWDRLRSAWNHRVTDFFDAIRHMTVRFHLAPVYMSKKDVNKPAEYVELPKYIEVLSERKQTAVILCSGDYETGLRRILDSNRVYCKVLGLNTDGRWQSLDCKPEIRDFRIQIEDSDHHEFFLVLDNTGLMTLKKNTQAILELLNDTGSAEKQMGRFDSTLMVRVETLHCNVSTPQKC